MTAAAVIRTELPVWVETFQRELELPRLGTFDMVAVLDGCLRFCLAFSFTRKTVSFCMSNLT